MNDLKSFIVLYDGKFIRAYKESEADKVIARNKYKRCLSMANVCSEKLYRPNLTTYGYEFYSKWLRRWLKLANKFKEEH